MDDGQPPRASALATVYFGYFAALGVFGPFVALYLEHRGLSPDRIAFLLALLPFFRVVSTPAWTALADRLHSASFVLRIVAVGSTAAFALLEWEPSGAALVLVLLAFTVFRSPATALMDVLTLQWSTRTGGAFGQVRAWGTVAYTLATFGAGVLIQDRGPAVIIPTALVLLALTSVATFALPRGTPPGHTPLLPALRVLLRRPRFMLFLATAALHQLGLGAYDALFPAYLTHLSDSTTAGFSIALGAAAEVLTMTLARGLFIRLGLTRTLAIAYGVSALRWALMAMVTTPWILVALQTLHAFTFGAFYLAGVALVDEESPPEVRASAQGIFGAVTWGLASSAGLAVAGLLQRHGGLPRVFMAAACLCALAALIALQLGARAQRDSA